ncbi:MAG: radical SAM protein [archaeon]
MKLLLINPPYRNVLAGYDIDLKSQGHLPPLSLLYVASALRGHQVAVLDADLEQLGLDDIAKRIRKENPDFIGLSVTTFTLIDCLAMARLAKEVNPDVRVIFGGPHPYLFPDETIGFKEVDYLILGEGEGAISDLLSSRLNAKGLVYMIGNKVIKTGSRQLIRDLDSIPFPQRRLLPYGSYTSVLSRSRPVTTMVISRGCPYRCTCCSQAHYKDSVRYRSASNVVAEIEACIRLGIREIIFYDETFTLNRDLVAAVCRGIQAKKLRISWAIRTRVDLVDDGLLRLMKRSGLARIHFGVESGNQKTLDTLAKGITIRQIERAFGLARDNNLETVGYFMIGSPGETLKMIHNTMAFARHLNPDYVQFSVTQVSPGTELHRQALEAGLDVDWRSYAKNPRHGFPMFWTKTLGETELKSLAKDAYRKFYLRWHYVLSQLARVRSLGDLRNKINAGRMLVFS